MYATTTTYRPEELNGRMYDPTFSCFLSPDWNFLSKFMLLACIMFLVICKSSAQSVAVELSIEWTKGPDVFVDDSMIVYPELSITYRNLSDTSYYFQKICDDYDGFPSLPLAELGHYPIEEILHPNYRERAKPPKTLPYDDYVVYIVNDPSYGSCWDVIKDTVSYESERLFDLINDEISDVYTYLRYKLYGDEPGFRCRGRGKSDPQSLKQKYEITDFENGGISASVANKFVFLPSNSSYSEKFSLIGFWTLGVGHFTFKLLNDVTYDYVLCEEYGDGPPKYHDMRVELPKEIDGFQLYTGKFRTNTVSLDMR